ncbi:MAG TPA: dTDP-4-dehydrorhamnose 3,5-epimerase [Vicinamibacterales bacterium]|jgi:dTDP-4-dehydrorhamnose 3,5-epimerase
MSPDLRIRSTDLPEVLVIEPNVFRDERGFFLETYRVDAYGVHRIPPFVQDNHSRSVRGTLRGLHLQWRKPQGKLVRVIEGEIFDVAVDVRRGSPTFGKWVGVPLSAENFRQCYVPPGFAHGFCVVSDLAQVEYKCTDFYDPGGEVGIPWNDPAVGVAWPIDQPILSARDQKHAPLLDQMDKLPAWTTNL